MIKLGCVSLMVLSCSAYGRNYGKAGCGFGSQLMGKDGIQVFAATTNASSYNQLIGITMGTSNCAPDGAAVAVMKQESFVASNYANLSKEMAQGQGESLEGLAQVLGCESAAHSEFAKYTQTNFGTIFQAPGSLAMLDRVKFQIAQNPTLTSACTLSQIY